jgi:hypothetical protein
MKSTIYNRSEYNFSRAMPRQGGSCNIPLLEQEYQAYGFYFRNVCFAFQTPARCGQAFGIIRGERSESGLSEVKKTLRMEDLWCNFLDRSGDRRKMVGAGGFEPPTSCV